MDGEPAGEDGEGQDWREAEATPEAGMRATRTLRPGRWLAAVPLLAACQGPREAGRTGPGGDSGGGLGRVDPATNRLLRPPLRGGEEPLALEALGGHVWSANHDDGTLRRMDAATGALEGTADLGVEPHGMAVAQGAIWVADAHPDAILQLPS
jgi:streptogramin lyase